MGASATTKLSKEIAVYEAKRAEFVEQHSDEFVLIKDDEVVGFFAKEIDAIVAGHQKYGAQAFLVRKVAESEAPILLTSLNVHARRQ